MQATIIESEPNRIALRIEIDTGTCRDFADCEEAIQQALNEAGVVATAAALKRFDTGGVPIERDGRRWSTKGEVDKQYETPYGAAAVARHVYQRSGGGATYCPLDERAGLVVSATPKFARMVASKYAEFGAARVQADLAENHGRRLSRGFVATLAEAVAAIAEARSEQAIYRLPAFDAPTETLVVALDEVDIAAFRPGPAAVAVGSIGFYDGDGRRQHVVYLAGIVRSETALRVADPGRFLHRMEKELERARQRLGPDAVVPDASPTPGPWGSPGDAALAADADGTRVGPGPTVVGISGGQPWCTGFLGEWATIQFIDPAKAEDLLAEAATAYFDRAWTPDPEEEKPEVLVARRRREKRRWVEDARDRLLSQAGLAVVIAELEAWAAQMQDDPGRETIVMVKDFLVREREAGRMNYADPRASHALANAGILADSARVIFGERVGHPKFKIGVNAARAILILRELTRTPGRWEQFWDQVTGKDRVRDRADPGHRRS